MDCHVQGLPGAPGREGMAGEAGENGVIGGEGARGVGVVVQAAPLPAGSGGARVETAYTPQQYHHLLQEAVHAVRQQGVMAQGAGAGAACACAFTAAAGEGRQARELKTGTSDKCRCLKDIVDAHVQDKHSTHSAHQRIKRKAIKPVLQRVIRASSTHDK